jgi:hypothetical protein
MSTKGITMPKKEIYSFDTRAIVEDASDSDSDVKDNLDNHARAIVEDASDSDSDVKSNLDDYARASVEDDSDSDTNDAIARYNCIIDKEEALFIDANAFWCKVLLTQDKIYKERNMQLLNEYLQNDYANLQIILSDKSHLPKYHNRISLHIVPNGEKNIPLMKQLYERRVPLNNIDVYCYRPYDNNQYVHKSITINNVTLKYSDLWFQGTIGYKDNKPIVNIIIVVKKEASGILKKEKVTFKNAAETSRDVYFQTEPLIDAYLDNIIGEYNLLNHIGYIELLPSDDPLVGPDSTFTELSDVRKLLALALKPYNYKHCSYCNYMQLQCRLLQCTKCKSTYYCGKTCQLSNWPIHKTICHL